MNNNLIQNNAVTLHGEICAKPTYSHKVFGEKFYQTFLNVERFSGVCDTVPLMLSERLIDVEMVFSGQAMHISGQFRSYNLCEKKLKLMLSVFVHKIEPLLAKECRFVNNIKLEGYVCKTPVCRKTPIGREIADILLAINRPYGKSDYIPCICWGRNAKYADNLEVGTKVSVSGRIQSRAYSKMLQDGAEETRTAYDVSVSRVEVIENEKQSD